ncbi:HvfC/BufC family peptide modification chaperone [Silvibacterium acidisoli]|uniref:HvfC/BufC family peptide modification chaperone n=1 Tax=Acidobacteriaceae bacterium ZG23-2 TaxID=2883246 RepID=UPI00406C5D32
MSELLELQRRVAAAVMQPLTRAETMPRKQPDGRLNRTEAEAMIKPNDRLTSFDRLEIYNRQYWFRLYSCFEEDFPGVKAIIGSTRFDKLMRAYLTERPSTSFSLRNLGSKLDKWLNENPEHLGPRPQLALDMARLEWAHIDAFDSAQLPPIDADELASINEQSILKLQPFLRVLELNYPVDDLLIELRSENGSADSSSNNASIERKRRHVRRVSSLPAEEIHLAVHRHDNSIYYKRLHREDYRLLDAVLSGKPLGEAIEYAFTDTTIPEEERGAFLQQAFATWAELGWFVTLVK